jgi:hypothetical protein
MSTAHATMAEGLWHSHHGRSEKALEAFQRAAGMVKKAFCVNSHTIVVLPMLAQSLRLRAAALENSNPQQCRSLRRRSLRLSRRAAWVSRLFPNARPLMLRELSAIQRDTGRLKSALRNATKSRDLAIRQQATYEQAKSALLRAEILQQLGRSEAESELEAAQAEMARFARVIEAAMKGPQNTFSREASQ